MTTQLKLSFTSEKRQKNAQNFDEFKALKKRLKTQLILDNIACKRAQKQKNQEKIDSIICGEYRRAIENYELTLVADYYY